MVTGIYAKACPGPSSAPVYCFHRRLLASSRMSRIARRLVSGSFVVVHRRALHQSAMTLRSPSWREWRLEGPQWACAKDAPMIAHHPQLERFPVPDLEASTSKLLRSAKALAKDDGEYQQLEKKVREFETDPQQGPKLQKRLKELAAKTRNWLAQDWDTLAYMAYRDPVAINVSYFYGFEKLPQGPPGSNTHGDDPAYVAASIICWGLHFRDQILAGAVTPDSAGAVKLDMEHYKWMFNACRIPHEGADYAVKIPENDPSGDFLIVIRHNHYFKVPIKDDQGNRLGVEAFRKTLQSIYDNTKNDGALPIGVLTGVNRDLWTGARKNLLSSKSENNSRSLDTIEKSAFVICLDDKTPSSAKNPSGREAFSKLLWHGDEHNRFWDKPVQWVIFDSGESGIIGEHSCMDGSPTARMNNDMTLSLLAGNPPPEPSNASARAVKPEKLSFDIDTATQRDIKEAIQLHHKAASENQLSYLLYERYGKNQIKERKVSPDGWCQMVMQLAFSLTYDGQSSGTYEAANVRRFDLGRTETVRVLTPEVRAWVQAMLDGKSTSDDEKRRLFRAAIAIHGKDMKDAGNGRGIDRHLFGLKRRLQPDEEVPALFSDALYQKSGHWRMSTSQIVGEHFAIYGWGAVTADGHGFAYLLRNKSLQFTLTAKTGLPNAEVVANMKKALDIVMDLMLEENESTLPKPKL